MSECDRCNDSGTIACRSRDGSYRCPGPVPDDARGVFESYCDCAIGRRLHREEVRHLRPLRSEGDR